MATVFRQRRNSLLIIPLLGALIRRLSAAPIALDQELLKVLVCPLSKEPLRYDADANKLINDKLGVVYFIVEGIPNLVPENAVLRKPNAENM